MTIYSFKLLHNIDLRGSLLLIFGAFKQVYPFPYGNIIMIKFYTKEGEEMNTRTEATIVHADKDMVLAKSGEYYVSVVKVNSSVSEGNYVVIVNEENLQGDQRDVLLKRFMNTGHLARFLLSVVPEYFVEKKIIKETYDAIQELITRKD